MKIGKTTINLEDIATITDCRKPENCEEWEIKYKQGGKIYFSTLEEEYSNAIGNITSKELESKMFEIIELLNKPVETTNEQLKLTTEFKIEFMNLMSKHMDLRNSDKIIDRDLYHSFLDWEKEITKLVV